MPRALMAELPWLMTFPPLSADIFVMFDTVEVLTFGKPVTGGGVSSFLLQPETMKSVEMMDKTINVLIRFITMKLISLVCSLKQK